MSGHRVENVTIVGPYTLKVHFDDKTTQRINFLPVLEGTQLRVLHDPAFFSRVAIDPETGGLAWPNGVTFEPAMLHDWPHASSKLAKQARAARLAESSRMLAKIVLVAAALAIAVTIFCFATLRRDYRFVTYEKDCYIFFTCSESDLISSIEWRKFTPLQFALVALGSVLASLLYVVIGAYIVRVCNAMWRWASRRDVRWDESGRMFLGAVWPVTFAVTVVLSLFLAVVNRTFDTSLEPK